MVLFQIVQETNLMYSAIFARIFNILQTLHQLKQSQNDDDGNPESQEVLEDQLSRQLTREYLDILSTVFHSRRGESGTTDENQMEEELSAVNQTSKDDTISELGLLVMKTKAVYPSIVLCVYNGLNWNDSHTCNKCLNICVTVVKQLLQQHEMSCQVAQFLFTMSLKGLHLHGQHDSLQARLLSLGLTLYESLRPLYPEMNEILRQVPNVKDEAIKLFDDKVLQTSPQKQMNEKKKKEAFKKLVADIIGKNIGQHFKEDIHIKNLPSIYRRAKKVQSILEEVANDEDSGICALFRPDEKTSTDNGLLL